MGAKKTGADLAPAAVEVQGICKAYGDLEVLRGVSFSMRAGGVYCLMAPSGSGKTTFFRVLLGLEEADSGQIVGVEPGQIATMFQEERLCEALTPVENVALVCPPAVRRSELARMLARVLPEECLVKPVSQLSGGMRRRVSLVRAVAYPSRMMLLDEPFTGLDTHTKARVIDFLLEERGGRTMLVSTHAEGDVALLGGEKIDLEQVAMSVRR